MSKTFRLLALACAMLGMHAVVIADPLPIGQAVVALVGMFGCASLAQHCERVGL